MLNSFPTPNRRISYTGDYNTSIHALKRLQQTRLGERPSSAPIPIRQKLKRPSTAFQDTVPMISGYEVTNPVKPLRDFGFPESSCIKLNISRPMTASKSFQFEIKAEKLDLNRKNLTEIPTIPSDVSLKLLNCQNNYIKKFDSLGHLSLLVLVDFYNNQIESMAGLDQLHCLRVLLLGRNRIKTIEGLENLTRLEIIDLHSNDIEKIENMNHLINLRTLNLESNRIEELPTLSLPNLGELNLKKNRIVTMYPNKSLKKLYRLSLSENKLETIADVEILFELPNLSELSLEENKVCDNLHFKTLLMSKLQSLKLLNGKRILGETKRIAARQIRKEESRRKDLERQVGYLQDRKKYIEQIKQTWGILFESVESPKREELLLKYQKGKMAYVELDKSKLFIYGSGMDALLRQESTNATEIVFDYVKFDTIEVNLNYLSLFPNLTSLHINTTHLGHLRQIHSLHVLKLKKLTISDTNAVTNSRLFHSFTIYTIPTLEELCGKIVDVSDHQKAQEQFGMLY